MSEFSIIKNQLLILKTDYFFHIINQKKVSRVLLGIKHCHISMETGGGDPVLTVDAQFSKLFESLIYNQKEQSIE